MRIPILVAFSAFASAVAVPQPMFDALQKWSNDALNAVKAKITPSDRQKNKFVPPKPPKRLMKMSRTLLTKSKNKRLNESAQ